MPTIACLVSVRWQVIDQKPKKKSPANAGLSKKSIQNYGNSTPWYWFTSIIGIVELYLALMVLMILLATMA